MDSLSKKISNLGIHDIRNAARFAQNMIIQYDPYQVDVRRATNTDSWGPTPKQLNRVLRNRVHVPMYLITEYTMKRLVDHMAKRPKNLYEKARKQYVNYGSEWRVVLKCLVVLEFLLLTCNSGQELEQILSCMNTHKHILTRDTLQFKVEFSSDGKMETHERGIRKKCEQLIQYLEDSAYLKRARAKHRQQAVQVHSSGSGSSVSASYNANEIRVGDTSSVYDLDDDLEDYTPQNTQSSEHSSGQRPKHSSIVDEQRRKRREILRERIKNSEKQRKASQAKQQPVIDLLDLDDDGVAGHATKNNDQVSKNNEGKNDKDGDEDDEDDDSDFGDFQSDVSSQLGAVPSSSSQNIATKDTASKSGGAHVLESQWDYISPPLTNSTSNSTAADTSSTKQPTKDAFADLFTYSKTHI